MIGASISELAAALAAKRISSVEITQAYLDRIAAAQPKLNAFITVDPDRSLAEARSADARIARGEAGPLTGIPIAHKDIFCAKGWPTTCGSKILSNFISPYDAHVVESCQAAGVVMLGKTNMDEFAMGSSNENSHFGPVRNPWRTDRVPGDLPGVQRQPSLQGSSRARQGPTRVARSANRRRSAGFPASNPPTDWYPATA